MEEYYLHADVEIDFDHVPSPEEIEERVARMRRALEREFDGPGETVIETEAERGW